MIETRQRPASCAELGCGPYHPYGHIVTELRQVTAWEMVEVERAGPHSLTIDDPRPPDPRRPERKDGTRPNPPREGDKNEPA